MNSINNYNNFLESPIPVIEQNWPEGTLPLVSVSSLVYNHISHLEICIKQLLKQCTSFPVEFVFHDDASTDGSKAILQHYVNTYPKLFKLVSQDTNIYHLNVRKIEDDVHKVRRGKYIANCEGDDYWSDPLKLEKQVAFLESNPDFSGVHTKVEYVNAAGDRVGFSNKVPPALYESDFGNVVLHSVIHTVSFMYRSEVLTIENKFIWELTNHYYDQYLFLATSLHGKIKYLNEVTAVYRVNVGVLNTWNRFSKARYTEECLHFFQSRISRDDWSLAICTKLKSVYAILYCCHAKSNDNYANDYLIKYVKNYANLYRLLPFFKFLRLVFSFDYNFIRGLFWHIVIFLSRGRILPKGIT